MGYLCTWAAGLREAAPLEPGLLPLASPASGDELRRWPHPSVPHRRAAGEGCEKVEAREKVRSASAPSSSTSWVPWSALVEMT